VIKTFLNCGIFKAEIIPGKLLPEIVDNHHRLFLFSHDIATDKAEEFGIELVKPDNSHMFIEMVDLILCSELAGLLLGVGDKLGEQDFYGF